MSDHESADAQEVCMCFAIWCFVILSVWHN